MTDSPRASPAAAHLVPRPELGVVAVLVGRALRAGGRGRARGGGDQRRQALGEAAGRAWASAVDLKLHRVDPESGSSLRPKWGFSVKLLGQQVRTLGQPCEF